MPRPNIKKMKSSGDTKNLILTLKSEDKKIQMKASQALAEMGTTTIEELIQTINDDSFVDIRHIVVETLSKIGLTAVQPLIEILNCDDPNVRYWVADELGKIKDQRAVHPLINALEDENPSVREQAARALGRIGDISAEKPMRNLLSRYPGNTNIQVAIGQLQICDIQKTYAFAMNCKYFNNGECKKNNLDCSKTPQNLRNCPYYKRKR